MILSALVSFVLGAAVVSAAGNCSVEQRLAYANQLAVGFNALGSVNTAEAFDKVPFGSPDRAGVCDVVVIPNGLGCGIPVATTGNGNYDFVVATRNIVQQWNVTDLVPFDNGTVLHSAEVQLGAAGEIPLPVDAHGYFYIDFNQDCRIYAIRAFGVIPTEVLGLLKFPDGEPSIPDGGLYPICSQLPVGSEK